MSYPLYVAFIWHQHQPLYKSPQAVADATGQYRLPWVRLHGVKDYLDLILILQKYPDLHQTVNLVPSLILQLEDYINGTAIDPYLALTVTPEGLYTLGHKQAILNNFFDANHHTLIDPHPRYAQLYEQRQEKGIAWCIHHWNDQDYADLTAWHNLAWIDPLFWDDPDIAGWLKQGQNFSLDDRQRIMSKQREIIGKIIPQHRKMQEDGQLEVTTSPYTHPILPLLADTNSGKVAIPEMSLPKRRFQWEEDIPRHLEKAKEIYVERFGCKPKGLWPSEQSVSPQILPYIAQSGFNWICSDEAVLGWTLDHYFSRDEAGNLYSPDLLYRPYRLTTPHGDLSIVFRDHRLSDLIGFSYGSMDADEAAKDLIGHLNAIADSLRVTPTEAPNAPLDAPWLVTIALDGENCWENYPQDGLPFLNALYQQLSQHSALELVTVSEFIEQFPPQVTLPAHKLHSGSWVDGSFSTWIGDPVKNKAWDLLSEARELVARHPEATEENNPEVWEALFAAEGSDWFWWFGQGHSSNHDAMFDQLFREHLCGIYRALNEPIPAHLRQPLEDHQRKRDYRPQSFIHPVIDGYGDEQDWDKAGKIEIGGAMGTMHRASVVQRLFYGLDHLKFYLRFDFQRGAKAGQTFPHELHLLWYYAGLELPICPAPLVDLPDHAPLNYLFHHHLIIDLRTNKIRLHEAQEGYYWQEKATETEMGWNECLEIGIPWHDLHQKPDAHVHLTAVLADEGQYRLSVLEEKLIKVQIP